MSTDKCNACGGHGPYTMVPTTYLPVFICERCITRPCKFDDACYRPDCYYKHTRGDTRAGLTKVRGRCLWGDYCNRICCPWVHRRGLLRHGLIQKMN